MSGIRILPGTQQNGACNDSIDKLVECARGRGQPETWLLAHMKQCGTCRSRFETERSLSDQLRRLRAAVHAGQLQAAHKQAARKEALIGAFEAEHRQARDSRWMWSVATAAVVLMGIVLSGPLIRRTATAPLQGGAPVSSPAATSEFAVGDEVGFMAVPYASPLAPGETLTEVHADLHRAALAKLGVNVDSTRTEALSADILLGQDGFPRAVRVSNEETQ